MQTVHLWFARVFFALSLLMSLTLPARPLTPDTQSRIAAALAAGDVAEVQSLLDDTEASDLERIYVAGLLLQRQGRHREAAELFRNVLIMVPDFRSMREALILSLVALEEYDGAIFHLDELIETEPNAERRRRYQNQRLQILNRRPYGFTFGLSIVPSSNINRATGTETINLGGLPFQLDTTEQSGVGMAFSLGAFRRMRVGEGDLLQFNLDTSATFFDDPSFNRGTLGGRLTYSRRSESGSWNVSGGASMTAYNDDTRNHRRYSISGRREWLQNERQMWGVSIGASRTDYSSAEYEGFDSHHFEAAVDVRRRLGNETIIGLSVGLGREITEDPRYQFNSFEFGLDANRKWQNGWQVGIGATYEHKPYSNPFGGFFPYRRKDNAYGLRISASNREFRFRNMLPSVSCSATRVSSNIPIFDDRNILECAVSLTQRF